MSQHRERDYGHADSGNNQDRNGGCLVVEPISTRELSSKLPHGGPFGLRSFQSQGADQSLEVGGSAVAHPQPYEAAAVFADEQEFLLIDTALSGREHRSPHGMADLSPREVETSLIQAMVTTEVDGS